MARIAFERSERLAAEHAAATNIQVPAATRPPAPVGLRRPCSKKENVEQTKCNLSLLILVSCSPSTSQSPHEAPASPPSLSLPLSLPPLSLLSLPRAPLAAQALFRGFARRPHGVGVVALRASRLAGRTTERGEPSVARSGRNTRPAPGPVPPRAVPRRHSARLRALHALRAPRAFLVDTHLW